ncbi:MAG TPA: hypothetical protein VMH22_10545 [bacterium]|nr:hypothetical protein [bacterium]
MPTDPALLRILDDEFRLLYDHELTRSDGWTSKGIALMGACGLVLSLVALRWPALVRPVGMECPWQTAVFWLVRGLPFIACIGTFIVATFLSLSSLGATGLQRMDEDELVRLVSEEGMESPRKLAAIRLAAYKNNFDIVNRKATKVNCALAWFVAGVISVCALALSLILLPS